MQTVIFSQNVFTSQNLCYAQFTGWRTTVQWMVPPYHTQIADLSIDGNKKQFNTVYEIRTHLCKFHDMQNNFWKLLKYSFHKSLIYHLYFVLNVLKAHWQKVQLNRRYYIETPVGTYMRRSLCRDGRLSLSSTRPGLNRLLSSLMRTCLSVLHGTSTRTYR